MAPLRLMIRSRKMLSVYSHLSRDVYALVIARFVNSLGQFVYPFLTLLLTERIGLAPAQAGIFVLLTAMSFVPGALIGGRLVDRIGRKRILVVTQVLGALFLLPGVFLLHSTAIAYLLIGANFFRAAARPASSALVTDRTTPSTRQAAFSLLYLGMNAGWAVGPLLAGFLFEHHAKLLFVGDALSTLLAAGLTIAAVRESKPNKAEMERAGKLNPEERPESGSLAGVLMRRPFLLILSLALMLLNFVYAQSSFTIPIQLSRLFGGEGAVFFGVVMTVNALAVVVFTTPIIAFTRRFPSAVNLVVVALLYAVGFGMMIAAHRIIYVLASVLVWSAGEIIMATNASVYLSNHTPASHRGRMNGLLPIFWNSGRAFNAPIVGALIEHHPLSSAWLLAIALSLAGGLLLLGLAMTDGRRKRQVHFEGG